MADRDEVSGWGATVRCWAVGLAALVLVGASASAYAQKDPFDLDDDNTPRREAPSGSPAAAPAERKAGEAQGRSITRSEFIERRRAAATRNGRDPERAAKSAARFFDEADTNHDGVVDASERTAFLKAHPELMNRGKRAQ